MQSPFIFLVVHGQDGPVCQNANHGYDPWLWAMGNGVFGWVWVASQSEGGATSIATNCCPLYHRS